MPKFRALQAAVLHDPQLGARVYQPGEIVESEINLVGEDALTRYDGVGDPFLAPVWELVDTPAAAGRTLP